MPPALLLGQMCELDGAEWAADILSSIAHENPSVRRKELSDCRVLQSG